MARSIAVSCPDCGLVHRISPKHVKYGAAIERDFDVKCRYCEEGRDVPDSLRVGASTLVPLAYVPERFVLN